MTGGVRTPFLWVSKRAGYAWGLAKGAVWLPLATGSFSKWGRLLGRTPTFRIEGSCVLGDRLRMRCHIRRSSVSVARNGRLVIGDDVGISQGVNIHVEREIVIGSRVYLGDEVRLLDSHMHPTRPGERAATAPIVIEDDVWVASRAVIMPGVTIGRGSVVGASAVVTRSCPPGSLIAGPAARVIDTFDVPDDFRRLHAHISFVRREVPS